MTIIVFVFGLLIGSFLNAFIYRSLAGGSIFSKHSQCPHCRHILGIWDLVPIASFVMLRGKCRYCRKAISWQYPMVELATACTFVLLYLHSNIYPLGIAEISNLKSQISNLGELFLNFGIVSVLIVIFVQDLTHYLVLDRVVLAGLILAIGFQIWRGDLISGFWGAIMLAGFFGGLYLVSRGRWIGLGDIKLGAFLGFLVGYPVVLVLFMVAYFSGALFSGTLLILRKKTLRDRLPFGTFLTFAALVAMLWGQEIINWYFRIIGIN